MAFELIIIGIGQTLRGDDGAGLAAVECWRKTFPATASRPNVRVEFTELPGLNLLSLLEGVEDAILVDAVCSGAPPGTLHLLTEQDLTNSTLESSSAHGWGVAETLALERQLTSPPPSRRIQVIGIEAGEVGMGLEISPQVTACLPAAANQIEEAIRRVIA